MSPRRRRTRPQQTCTICGHGIGWTLSMSACKDRGGCARRALIRALVWERFVARWGPRPEPDWNDTPRMQAARRRILLGEDNE